MSPDLAMRTLAALQRLDDDLAMTLLLAMQREQQQMERELLEDEGDDDEDKEKEEPMPSMLERRDRRMEAGVSYATIAAPQIPTAAIAGDVQSALGCLKQLLQQQPTPAKEQRDAIASPSQTGILAEAAEHRHSHGDAREESGGIREGGGGCSGDDDEDDTQTDQSLSDVDGATMPDVGQAGLLRCTGGGSSSARGLPSPQQVTSSMPPSQPPTAVDPLLHDSNLFPEAVAAAVSALTAGGVPPGSKAASWAAAAAVQALFQHAASAAATASNLPLPVEGIMAPAPDGSVAAGEPLSLSFSPSFWGDPMGVDALGDGQTGKSDPEGHKMDHTGGLRPLSYGEEDGETTESEVEEVEEEEDEEFVKPKRQYTKKGEVFFLSGIDATSFPMCVLVFGVEGLAAGHLLFSKTA